MIHGIYLKSRPKGSWHLIMVAASPEAAAHDVEDALAKARLEGNDKAEVISHCFETSFHIPELLNITTPQKSMFN